MNKNDVLIYGVIIQGDIFKEHGANEQDEEMLQIALNKTYGVTEESSDEEVEKLEEDMIEDLKRLAEEYREKVKAFINK